jgi:beta-lactamase superfamily II metal-dependent hydrolase
VFRWPAGYHVLYYELLALSAGYSSLFTGDGEAQDHINGLSALCDLTKHPLQLFMHKVSHHGSRLKGSNTANLFNRVHSRFYVISGGQFRKSRNPTFDVVKMIVDSRRLCATDPAGCSNVQVLKLILLLG